MLPERQLQFSFTQNSDILKNRYDEYRDYMRRIADVKYAAAVLQWDQETYLPPKGASFRGQQLATLSEIAHELFVKPSFGDLLKTLVADPSLEAVQKRNVALTLEDFDKNGKYPSAFVRRMSEATSTAYHAWIAARKENDFRVFEKPLADLVALKREEAHLLGFKHHPYDALLNEFEKGATVAWLDNLFREIRPVLKNILDGIMRKPAPPADFLHQHFDKDAQWKFGLDLLKIMGFDFEAGRQDISEHPFTTNFSALDVRVTTRIDENDFASMAWSCLHEGGHALYEQGLPEGQYGLPLGEFCSLGIHESQSRLWENCIGRGLPFISYIMPLVKRYFPQLANAEARQLFAAVNKVQPSLIRTEADELTYHFHVVIRYEIEKKLIDGSLEVKDLPGYWSALYKELLGVTVPGDRQGCLQDIHWSHGSFGYFPTYTLGSLYAAQFFAYVKKQFLDLDQQTAQGDFSALHSWLRKNIYQYGRRYTSEELCNKITGEPLNLDHFRQYITEKYSLVYQSSL